MKKKSSAKSNIWETIFLFFLIAVLGTILLLRFLSGDAEIPETKPEQPEFTQPVSKTEQILPSHKTELEEAAGIDVDRADPEESVTAEKEEQAPVSRSMIYSEYTYSLATDMVHTWRHRQTEGAEEIARLLGELNDADPALGKLWAGIMSTWIYVDTEMECHYDRLPDGLAEDDRLCIVVLGYQLKADGSMAPELIGRCETALRCAEQYPNAYIAVTGGGTASKDRSATEADAMADWLISH